MGIFKRFIIIICIVTHNPTHAVVCDNQKNICTENQHWIEINQTKQPITTTKINSHLSSWSMIQMPFAQIHGLLDVQTETGVLLRHTKEIFLKIHDPYHYIYIIAGKFHHPSGSLLFPIFGAYHHQIEKKFTPPIGEGVWLSFDNHSSSLLEIAATSDSSKSFRYSYDTHYIGGTRFTVSHTQGKHQRMSTFSLLTRGSLDAFFLLEIKRLKQKNEDFQQLLRILYQGTFEHGYRKFFQYDDILKKHRRFLLGVDFDISNTQNELHLKIFQEYINTSDAEWIWSIHTGIEGKI